MTIDIRSLRYFAAIAETGSISKAAEEVHVAQPALSLQLRKLEEDLGVRLVERTPKGVVLTSAGEKFLRHSQDVLARLKFACDDVRDFAAEPTGTVALGMAQSIGMALTVPLVKEVLLRWPKVDLQIIESSTGHIHAHLANRTVDLGMTFLQAKNSGLRYRKLLDEELVLLGPPGAFHDAKRKKRPHMAEVELRDLSKLPFFLPSKRHSLRQLIERYADQTQTHPKVLADVDAIHQLISLVADGLGYTILSYATVRTHVEQGKVSAARLVNPRIERQVFLCRLESTPISNATLAVESLIVDTMDRLVAEGQWIGRPG